MSLEFGQSAIVKTLMTLIMQSINLSEKSFSSLLAKIIIITFRYNIICGKNPNEQENVYNKIALKIEETKSYDVEELKSGIYVSDAEFEQTFMYKELVYTSRNNKIAKYILGKIEKFESGADIDTNESSLEHILPDNPNEDWNWEVGKNNNLGNSLFAEKKEVYKSSKVPMTLKIGESDIKEWTEENIECRQKTMAKEAKGIWRI